MGLVACRAIGSELIWPQDAIGNNAATAIVTAATLGRHLRPVRPRALIAGQSNMGHLRAIKAELGVADRHHVERHSLVWLIRLFGWRFARDPDLGYGDGGELSEPGIGDVGRCGSVWWSALPLGWWRSLVSGE